MRRSVLALAVTAAFAGAVQANNQRLEEITIIGDREAAQALPGSGAAPSPASTRPPTSRPTGARM